MNVFQSFRRFLLPKNHLMSSLHRLPSITECFPHGCLNIRQIGFLRWWTWKKSFSKCIKKGTAWETCILLVACTIYARMAWKAYESKAQDCLRTMVRFVITFDSENQFKYLVNKHLRLRKSQKVLCISWTNAFWLFYYATWVVTAAFADGLSEVFCTATWFSKWWYLSVRSSQVAIPTWYNQLSWKLILLKILQSWSSFRWKWP